MSALLFLYHACGPLGWQQRHSKQSTAKSSPHQFLTSQPPQGLPSLLHRPNTSTLNVLTLHLHMPQVTRVPLKAALIGVCAIHVFPPHLRWQEPSGLCRLVALTRRAQPPVSIYPAVDRLVQLHTGPGATL